MAFFMYLQILSVVGVSFACVPPPGWAPKPMLELIEGAGLVVYGQLRNVTESGSDWSKIYSYALEVCCVMKNGDSTQGIGRNIIFNEYDRPPNCVTTSKLMVNENIIVMLRVNRENKFYVGNANMQRGVFSGSDSNLSEIAKSCNVTGMYAPPGSQCPQVSQVDTTDHKEPDTGATLRYGMSLLLFSVSVGVFANFIF